METERLEEARLGVEITSALLPRRLPIIWTIWQKNSYKNLTGQRLSEILRQDILISKRSPGHNELTACDHLSENLGFPLARDKFYVRPIQNSSCAFHVSASNKGKNCPAKSIWCHANLQPLNQR